MKKSKRDNANPFILDYTEYKKGYPIVNPWHRCCTRQQKILTASGELWVGNKQKYNKTNRNSKSTKQKNHQYHGWKYNPAYILRRFLNARIHLLF